MEGAPAVLCLEKLDDVQPVNGRCRRSALVPPIGLVELVDPATGRRRELRVTADVQRRYAVAASRLADARMQLLRRAGADVIELDTESDWLGAIVRHVRRRKVQAVHVQRVQRATGHGTRRA